MNLNNFETHCGRGILERGFEYYRLGNIVSLEYLDKKWIAKVGSSENYTVMVKFAVNDEILKTSCDCPYDQGDYCIHQAAVFYALKNKGPPHKNTTRSTKEHTLEKTLKELDKQTLLSIVLDLASKHKPIREDLLLRYVKNPDAAEAARIILQRAFKGAKQREAVDYRNADQIYTGTTAVDNMIDDKISTGDLRSAVQLCVLMLEELMDLMEQCDDSDGHIWELISETIAQVGQVIFAIPVKQEKSEEIFDIVFTHARNSIYHSWHDWQEELLILLIGFCDNPVNRDKMERYLSQQVTPGNSWGKLKKEQLEKVQYALIKQLNGEKVAVRYAEQHLDNSEFRRIAIEAAISGEQFERALELCFEGEQKNALNVKLVREWKKFRYEVYEKTKDVQSQASLGVDLLLEGDFDHYFSKLKALHNDSQEQSNFGGVWEKFRSNTQSNNHLNDRQKKS
ncbi:MAG: SWIM zinc finger domain-containing protein [Nitrososphaerota archaeon]|nr:SWIM zinc finger domain-containing protein [Nitrososphaerota archaeon]